MVGDPTPELSMSSKQMPERYQGCGADRSIYNLVRAFD
jgi:hypothetical protein